MGLRVKRGRGPGVLEWCRAWSGTRRFRAHRAGCAQASTSTSRSSVPSTLGCADQRSVDTEMVTPWSSPPTSTAVLVPQPCEVTQIVPCKIIDLPRQTPQKGGLLLKNSQHSFTIHFWNLSSRTQFEPPSWVVGLMRTKSRMAPLLRFDGGSAGLLSH